MSPLGESVADLLGDVWRGIYHLDTPALQRVDWMDDYSIRFILSYRNLATWDGQELTMLVVLSHDRLLRLDIDAVAPHRIELLFHQRKEWNGDISEGMPTVEQHIGMIRKWCPLPD
jgi:hypothetical protein